MYVYEVSTASPNLQTHRQLYIVSCVLECRVGYLNCMVGHFVMSIYGFDWPAILIFKYVLRVLCVCMCTSVCVCMCTSVCVCMCTSVCVCMCTSSVCVCCVCACVHQVCVCAVCVQVYKCVCVLCV